MTEQDVLLSWATGKFFTVPFFSYGSFILEKSREMVAGSEGGTEKGTEGIGKFYRLLFNCTNDNFLLATCVEWKRQRQRMAPHTIANTRRPLR
jgi:hypothetical protein